MPGDYRNSLGFLNLQLRASQLQQDQQRQYALEQYGREAQQQDVQNTLAFMKQHEAAKSASEDRKLQLAAMLQKAAEDRALKEQIANQGDTTKRRGQDLSDQDRDALRALKEGQDAIKNALAERKQNEVERSNVATEQNAAERNMVAASGQENSFTGEQRNPVVERDARGMPTRLGSPAPTPEGYIQVGKKGKEAAVKAVDESVEQMRDANDAVSLVEKAPPEFFGPTRGGTKVHVPVISKIMGRPLTIGANSWKDLEANFDSLSPEDKAKVSERRAAGQAIGRLIQQYRHAMTGAAFSDQESRGYAETITGFNIDDPFSNDQKLLTDALKRTGAHIQRRTQLLAQIAKTGLRPDPTLTNDQLEKSMQSGAQPAPITPGSDILKQAMNDPVVSRKLKDAESRLPAGLTPEQKEAALAALARRLLPQQVSP